MGDGYKLKGIPDNIPSTIGEYVEAMNASDRVFPHDLFFPVRDVSYIRPSRYGTIEFRSACSNPVVDEILEIVCWRVVELISACSLGRLWNCHLRSWRTPDGLSLSARPVGTAEPFKPADPVARIWPFLCLSERHLFRTSGGSMQTRPVKNSR